MWRTKYRQKESAKVREVRAILPLLALFLVWYWYRTRSTPCTGGVVKKDPARLAARKIDDEVEDRRRRGQTISHKSSHSETLHTMSADPIITLVLVDVQKDFHPGGSLAIPTADEDAARIATLLTEHPTKITRVVATMDSHQKLHIAHPGFWLSGGDDDSKATHPSPFTIISSQDIVDGKWKPRTDLKIPLHTIDGSIFDGLNQVLDSEGTIDLKKYAIEYTKRLEAKGKFKLCIWPEHCLIGSPGHCMVDVVFEAVKQWSQSTGGSVEWVLKGQNLLTESYSAIEAEVPLDKATSFASELQDSLEKSDHLIVCGQAMSHCVNYTTRSIIERWPKEKISNITLLTDCASSVPGFEEAGASFQKEMSELGVKLKASTELFT